MSELNIIGYSSDDADRLEPVKSSQWYLDWKKHSKDYGFKNSPNELPQITKQKIRLKNWSALELLEKEVRNKQTFDRESHVYLINGEKRYYRIYRELSDFIGCRKVEYLGIAQEPIFVPKIKPIEKTGDIKRFIGRTAQFIEGMTCCYCEIKLTSKNFTREHVIPKHKGGKIIMACCNVCNNEKGGLMLHSYIQMLNLMMKDFENDDFGYAKNQKKIINANKIAKEVEQ